MLKGTPATAADGAESASEAAPAPTPVSNMRRSMRAREKGMRAGRRHLEAHRGEDVLTLVGNGHVLGADRKHRRNQQALHRRSTVEYGLELLVKDAFMRSMHVDQYQASGILGQDVDAVQLSQRVAQRSTALGLGERRRHCARRVVCGLDGLRGVECGRAGRGAGAGREIEIVPAGGLHRQGALPW